jgi:hypothetical protein
MAQVRERVEAEGMMTPPIDILEIAATLLENAQARLAALELGFCGLDVPLDEPERAVILAMHDMTVVGIVAKALELDTRQ